MNQHALPLSRVIPSLPAMIFFILTALQGGCSTMELTSRRSAAPVIIDGRNTEWGGALTNLEDKRISVGVSNDDEFLNIILATADQTLQRSIINGGLTFWFDPAGGKEKTFGIHYPLRRNETPFAPAAEDRGGERMSDRGTEIDSRSSEIEILSGEKTPHRMTLAEAAGIEVRLRPEGGILVYELRIPLRENASHPFAIGRMSTDALGVGILAPGGQSRQRPGPGVRTDGWQGDDGPPPLPEDEQGDRGMRPPGGPGGFEGSFRGTMALELWMKVKLDRGD